MPINQDAINLGNTMVLSILLVNAFSESKEPLTAFKALQMELISMLQHLPATKENPELLQATAKHVGDIFTNAAQQYGRSIRSAH